MPLVAAMSSTGVKALAVTVAAIVGAAVGFYLQAKAQDHFKMDVAAEVKRLVDEEEREDREKLQQANSAVEHRSSTQRLL